MDILALATDYDETLAEHGTVASSTYFALRQLKETGRKLILVTGRELPDLMDVFPGFSIFDKIVAENGALLYTPETKQQRLLAAPPPANFIARLRLRGVDPLLVGKVVVATRVPHEALILDEIHQLGLGLEIIFNRESVMVLPSGVNKATGLATALGEMELSTQNVVGIGDAENDCLFLRAVRFSVAVANALENLKDEADRITSENGGAGVSELIQQIISNDAGWFTQVANGDQSTTDPKFS